MTDNKIINWLLDGDSSIRYQVYRDLLSIEREKLRQNIEIKGWGKRLLSLRAENGH